MVKSQELPAAQPLPCVYLPPAAIPLATTVATSLMLSCADAFCHGRLQTRIAGALHEVDPLSFCDLFCEIELSLRSGAHCKPHLPKVLRCRQFFNILKWKSISGYSPVRFLLTTFADRGPQPRKQRPYFGDSRSHVAREKKIAPESVFTLIHTFPNCYLHFPATG